MNDDIEPSLDEQLSEDIAAVRNDVFAQTGVKMNANDPVIEMVFALEKIALKRVDAIAQQLDDNHQRMLASYDAKFENLQELLTKLDNQKEVIVANVWQKLNAKIATQIESQLTKDIQAIARNQNNKINNQRNMFIGGIAGLLVGILMTALLAFVLT